MTSYIDAYKDQFGVEPICQVLEVAPSTYYAATSRPTSARRLRDEELKVEIARVHEENFGVYGVEKVWRQLNREGVRVGRDRVARLMRELNLEGVVRGKRKRTTVAGELDERPEDLVDRESRTLGSVRGAACEGGPYRDWTSCLRAARSRVQLARARGRRRRSAPS
jgi:putative transposase